MKLHMLPSIKVYFDPFYGQSQCSEKDFRLISAVYWSKALMFIDNEFVKAKRVLKEIFRQSKIVNYHSKDTEMLSN